MNRADFSFDKRVAERYETQRKHPADVSAQIGAAIAALVGGERRVLELGIGTGRIASPVAAAGCEVVGFDISAEMLEKAPHHLALSRADMRHIPFRADSFDAALAVHVLHLVRDWQRVMCEMMRVLKPNGVFIRGDDWIDPTSVFGRLRDELRQRAVKHAPQMMPPAAGISKEQFLREHGGSETREMIVAEWTTTITPAQRLEMYEQKLDNESWFLPAPLFDTLLAELRAFSAATWPDQDAPQPVLRRFILTVTTGNWEVGS
jgi:ubiquinone/menaquinone biosynthesis C-methylase UbiE